MHEIRSFQIRRSQPLHTAAERRERISSHVNTALSKQNVHPCGNNGFTLHHVVQCVQLTNTRVKFHTAANLDLSKANQQTYNYTLQ